MGFTVLKTFVQEKIEQVIAIMLYSPSDGRPYYSCRRARPGLKIGTAMVLEKTHRARKDGQPRGFRTDVWLAEGGQVVVGGYTCPRCHKRLLEPHCECGAEPKLIRVPLRGLGPEAQETARAALTLEPGEAPFTKYGVVKGPGMIASAKEAGRLPLGDFPDGAVDAVLFISDRLGRDLVEGEGEEQILIPLTPDLVLTNQGEVEKTGAVVVLEG